MISAITSSFFPATHSSSISLEPERNVIAAIFSVKLIVLLCVAVALPNWYYLSGAGCGYSVPVDDSIVMRYFHGLNFPKNYSHYKLDKFGLTADARNCLTPNIMGMQQIILGLCLLSAFLSFNQFYCDLLANNMVSNCIRRFAFGSILAVITIIFTIGTCWYTTNLIEQQQQITKRDIYYLVEVKFGTSYYLLAAAGLAGIIAAACDLLKCKYLVRGSSGSHLISEQQDETFSVALPYSNAWVHVEEEDDFYVRNFPPPPPYTP